MPSIIWWSLYSSHFSHLKSSLGPFAQVELLDCYCDADRIIVAEIESKIRCESFPKSDWVAGLQICLGANVVLVNSDNRKKRAKIGRSVKVGAEDYGYEYCKVKNAGNVFMWISQMGYLSSNCVLSDGPGYGIRTREIIHRYRDLGDHWEVSIESATGSMRKSDTREVDTISSNYQKGYRCSCHYAKEDSSVRDMIETQKNKRVV